MHLGAAPERIREHVLERHGRLDLLVNNAGATKRGDFLELTDADWEDGYALKFFGAMRGARAAWPHLQRSQGGIINIVGIGGRTGSAEFAIGGSVNASALILTKCLADRGLRDGVRVNAINPGSMMNYLLFSANIASPFASPKPKRASRCLLYRPRIGDTCGCASLTMVMPR